MSPNPARSTWGISGDTVTQYTADIADADHRDLIRWLYAHAQVEKLSLKETAAAVKIHENTLYRIVRNQYGAKLDKIAEKIRSYKALIDERATFRRVECVVTTICEKIWQACEWAHISQSVTCIWGDSQIGKTTALEEYQRRHNHGQTRLVRMPASAGVQLMMKEIAKACFISDDSSFERLRDRVLRSLDGSNLLIVDELHQVFTSYQKGSAIKCLEVIREIHDRCKCGLVLCATNYGRDELTNGKHRELLKQFTRRGIVQVQLPGMAPEEDVLRIAAAYHLEEPTGKAADLVDDIISKSGLGKFTKFLQAAARFAEKRKEHLAWKHFIAAHDIIARLSMEGGE